MADKKQIQLGMNPSTASGRLMKDILFNFVVKTGSDTCHQCGEQISRENFSVEHKTPWLDSEDPVGLYFDLSNIAYSHLRCNVAARRVPKIHVSRKAGNNASGRKVWAEMPEEDRKQQRRRRYDKYGC